jgi:hypothetical protein
MKQPDCLGEMLPARDLLADIPPAVLESRNLLPADWMWVAVFAAVIVFELWAVLTDNYTMSEAVWRWPAWRKWLLGLGFLGLLYHLFLQR